MMNLFKRAGALLVCMMMVLSCMAGPAFAGEIKNNEGMAGSINDVSASMSGEGANMNLTIKGITDVGDQTSVWEEIFTEYRGVIVGLSGIGAITMIVFFIINFMKLGASAGNPQARTQALVGIIWTGLAAAGLGGVTIFVGFFYNILQA